MASSTKTNGRTDSRISDLASDGTGASRRSRSSKDVTARMSGPYAKPTRLCLYVPKHIVSRLEAHALAQGKSRDEFAADCLSKYMAATYSKRDELLQNAYGVSEEKPE